MFNQIPLNSKDDTLLLYKTDIGSSVHGARHSRISVKRVWSK